MASPEDVLCALAGAHNWITYHDTDTDELTTYCEFCGEITSIELRDEG
jgi:hypothetical protein